MSILERLNRKDIFSPSELEVANYIINNKETAVHLTVKELAKVTYTGSSTVMRFIKKVYNGSFSDFKIDLAYELRHLANSDKFILQEKEHETAIYIIDKIADIQKEVIEQSKLLLDHQQIEDIIRLIDQANIIYIFAEGINAQIGHEFKYAMSRLGKHVEIADSSFRTTLNCLDENSRPLSIYVDHYENENYIKKMIKLNYQQGIPGIWITNKGNDEVFKYCNEVIKIIDSHSHTNQGMLVHTTAVKYVLNVIIGCAIAIDH